MQLSIDRRLKTFRRAAIELIREYKLVQKLLLIRIFEETYNIPTLLRFYQLHI